MPVSNSKKVLVCPLDWGIGHATRLVPVINELLKQDFQVIIGANNRPLEFLKNEFPKLKFVPFPGITITYPTGNKMALRMLFQTPKLLLGIMKEHQLLKKIIKENDIQYVISDNRYGLWNSKIKSVFITHQIGIKSTKRLGILKPFLLGFSKFFINKYDELWIPDFEDEPNLSGSLAHGFKIKIPSFYIGPLSRFSNSGKESQTNNQIMAIVSGPEPQRTIFEKLLISELKNYDGKVIILRGQTEKKEVEKIDNIRLYSHLSTPEFSKFLQKSRLIICRSGYCTLMDLAVFKKKAILIPTPGQTEQEYLAKKLSAEKIYFTQSQSKFSLQESLDQINSYPGIQLKNDYQLLKERIKSLVPI